MYPIGTEQLLEPPWGKAWITKVWAVDHIWPSETHQPSGILWNVMLDLPKAEVCTVLAGSSEWSCNLRGSSELLYDQEFNLCFGLVCKDMFFLPLYLSNECIIYSDLFIHSQCFVRFMIWPSWQNVWRSLGWGMCVPCVPMPPATSVPAVYLYPTCCPGFKLLRGGRARLELIPRFPAGIILVIFWNYIYWMITSFFPLSLLYAHKRTV